MKKTLILILSVGLVVVLAACSAGPTAATSAPSSTVAAPNGTPSPGGFQQSPTTQLLMGTFALEATDTAVTAEQAQTLLPLWQALQALSTSDTTAAAELSAIETQLRGAYTAAQLAVIDALTQEQIQQVMTEQGLDFGRGAFPEGTPPAGVDGTGFPGGGGGPPPDGGFPDGGPGGGGGFDPNNLSPEQQAALATRQAGGGGFGGPAGAGVPAPLLQAVIDLLTTRAET